jgi:hypothetical protein
VQLNRRKPGYAYFNFSTLPSAALWHLPLMIETPPVQQQSPDNDHLRLLAIFHYIVSALTALFACIPIIHLVIGLFLILAPQKLGNGNNQPPAFLGWLFVGLASFFILAGWTFAVLVLIAGRFIARRKHFQFCFVMACVECMLMPFGTVLGVFTILVLNRPTVEELFAVNAQASKLSQATTAA